MTVAGVSFRKKDVLRFMQSTEQTLELELEPNNPNDKNAVKVIGVTSSDRYFLGYVPKEISEQIISTGVFDKVNPRLVRLFQGNNDYLEVQFQIVGPTEHKNDFDAFLENQPVNASQKDYLKFFNIPVAKGLTTGDAFKQIAKHRVQLETEDRIKLDEYDAYSDILDEFDDSDFRDTYAVKKPSRTALNDALKQLLLEGKTYIYLNKNIDEVVEKLLKIKPDLEQNM
jgi:hypothetical protein